MAKLCDLTLGLHCKAWAVAHILAGRSLNTESHQFRISTAPWYNGREQGFVFSILDTKGWKQLNIAVFEHRNSDSICALRWENNPDINPPTLESDGKLAYPTDNKFNDITHSVAYDQAGLMAEWVAEQMQDWADERGEQK